MLTGASNFNLKHNNRALAEQTLGELGEANSKLRKLFIPTLRTACNALAPGPRMIGHPKNDVQPLRVAAMEALARFGKDAQPDWPMLKKLKLDPVAEVPKAARSVVDLLESPKMM